MNTKDTTRPRDRASKRSAPIISKPKPITGKWREDEDELLLQLKMASPELAWWVIYRYTKNHIHICGVFWSPGMYFDGLFPSPGF
jgi:hypothetical protein